MDMRVMSKRLISAGAVLGALAIGGIIGQSTTEDASAAQVQAQTKVETRVVKIVPASCMKALISANQALTTGALIDLAQSRAVKAVINASPDALDIAVTSIEKAHEHQDQQVERFTDNQDACVVEGGA